MEKQQDKHVFDEPIKRGEKTIAEVELRKPSAGELRGLSMVDVLQIEVSSIVKLVPRISTPSLTEAEVNAMGPSDLVGMGTIIAGFCVPKSLSQNL